MDLEGDRAKVNGLSGFSRSSLLLFLEGEQKAAGSTFSLSKSSKVDGWKGLLEAEKMLLVERELALPSEAFFCMKMPMFVSTALRISTSKLRHAYHSVDSSYSPGAVDASYREVQMALVPLEHE